MSQKSLIEQLDEKNIYIKSLEFKVSFSRNMIYDFKNGIRIIMKENENLKDSLHQYKIKIAELEEKDIQSVKDSYEALKKTNSYYAKIQDLVRINKELSREIDLNNMTKKMRELNEEDKRRLRP